MRCSSAVDALLAARSSNLVAGTRLKPLGTTRLPRPAFALRPRHSASSVRAWLPASTPDLASFSPSVERVVLLSSATSTRGLVRAIIPNSSTPALAMAAAATTAVEPAEVLVKAATGSPDKLGDCPFSHRVLLTLEEKGIPYSMKLVDTSNKPQWFLDVNPEGKVPVLKVAGGWLPDSDKIVEELEKKYPDSRKLANTPEQSSVASGLFGSFARFLKGAGPEEDLLAQLKQLDDALAASGGPYVAGKEFTAVDARLAPALYHIQVALKHFKDWTIPAEYTHVQEYIKALESRDSFKKTTASKEAVIAGWNRALGVTA